MSTITKHWTYDDLCQLPDDGKRYEILEGELYELPGPLSVHWQLVMRLIMAIGNFVQEHRLGIIATAPADIRLSSDTVVQPDIFFISEARTHIIDRPGVDGAPDLVVEILSPSNREHDLVRKFAIYARYGIREYWIVDPDEQTLRVYALSDGQYALHEYEGGLARSVVLAGLTVDVAALFADLL
jgi:Uma2 family endonuclease